MLFKIRSLILLGTTNLLTIKHQMLYISISISVQKAILQLTVTLHLVRCRPSIHQRKLVFIEIVYFISIYL
jgi:hypothetical protein